MSYTVSAIDAEGRKAEAMDIDDEAAGRIKAYLSAGISGLDGRACGPTAVPIVKAILRIPDKEENARKALISLLHMALSFPDCFWEVL